MRREDLPPTEADVVAGINSIEGHLMAEHERGIARREAAAFGDRLPWLPTAQREDVVGLYIHFRTASSRRQAQAVAARCAELREEYEQRYRVLRLRLLRRCTTVVLTAVSLCAALCLLVVLGG